ncbi:MAG: DnaJ domain-containing protein [Thaumarchaeota archaeon]|nr:DnaJ domain-containing protein [Nitrososphaerota archaeon]
MELENCYRLLGVRKDAELSDIKLAFRRLALEYHPDRNKTPGTEGKFTEINEAYSIIMSSKGAIDGWRPADPHKAIFYGEARAELSFAILTDQELVYHVPAELFEKEIRKHFNPRTTEGTFCRVGKRWFEIDDQAQSKSLLPWGSGRRGTLTEWYKTPGDTDKWKSTSWEAFWSYVHSYASLTVGHPRPQTPQT